MRQLSLTFISMLYIASAQSCATAGFYIPNNRFQSPETSGAFGNGLVAAGHGSKTKAVVANGLLSTDQAILDSAEVKSG
jgi:hypothetical protein